LTNAIKNLIVYDSGIKKERKGSIQEILEYIEEDKETKILFRKIIPLVPQGVVKRLIPPSLFITVAFLVLYGKEEEEQEKIIKIFLNPLLTGVNAVSFIVSLNQSLQKISKKSPLLIKGNYSSYVEFEQQRLHYLLRCWNAFYCSEYKRKSTKNIPFKGEFEVCK